MLDSIPPSVARFLADLGQIQARAERAERQISSGRKINSASDDPDRVQELLVARAHLEQTTQISANLGRAKAEVDTAEQVLEKAVEGLDRAAELGVEGANTTETPESRKTLAVEAQAVLENLVAVSQTNVEGRYLFSGDSDRTAPYTLDLTRANGVSPYAGSAATREVLHPAGTRFTLSKTAQEIFDDPSPQKNVFAAVNSLRLALVNGPTVPPGDPAYQAQYDAQTAAIDGALGAVRSSRDHLSGELAFYGTTQNRVNDALDFAKKLELRQQTAVSNLGDADVTAAALELSLASTHQQAALAARARLPTSSLFDYLA
jgi:flagellar hook-associated protein 3 FlgL